MLESIFSNTNEWLKFAEAKSASLIAGNLALIFGITEAAKDSTTNILVLTLAIAAISQLLISSIFLLISFIPSLQIRAFDIDTPGDGKNLIYFANIKNQTPYEFARKIKEASDCTEKITDYQIMLAEQIINNAKITNKKYQLFKIAIWLTTSAIATPLVAAFIFYMRDHK
ncbi:Pycsar system effector family protein [Ectopseudomonas khazarica]|uniref:Pycsar system effector family protein n=1 Tax=Ectopseudomonas khazarica TaxID=2502979 RepID=UPI0037C63A92